MEIGNEILYETFCYKPIDTWDKARIDDLGWQTVVDGGKDPRFRLIYPPSCIDPSGLL
jgi:hypothetical protein